MEFEAFLKRLCVSKHYAGQIVYVHKIPNRDAQYGTPDNPIPAEIESALAKLGISRLYTHQVSSVEHTRAGKSIAVVTPAASGKTLCYNLPVMESLLRKPSTTAFYLFPTKALAQDQLRGLRRYSDVEPAFGTIIKAGTYDGDTPPTTRRRLRDEANIILTNPDMLHQGILPYHTRWNRFFANLRFVVVDEIHIYRGIFGSNVANVIRRLRRVCAHYGSNPQFICSSATIANPGELAKKLTGTEIELINDNGSPKGEKLFVLWNPPCVDPGGMERRSSNVEAQHLMVQLLLNGVRTITFGRARIVAELMCRYVKEALEHLEPQLASKVRAYRGGYLPEERREIERQLFSGELMGITSTNALELGIDVGGLDAAVIVGFPGTVAALWQQAGRAGRASDQSLVVFVAYNDPIDQYLMRHPDYFLGLSPENAIIDSENPNILASHLRCAAFELPLKENDACLFGRAMPAVARVLEEVGDLKQIDKNWYWSKTDFPAADVNLRTISDNTFTIVDTSGVENKVIGQVDAISAPELVYPEAIYMHEAQTYFVNTLDLESKVAYVEPIDADYYTNAILEPSIRVLEPHPGIPPDKPPSEGNFPSESHIALNGSRVCYGQAVVTWITTGFKKIKFYSLDSIGYGTVNLPPQHLETAAFWIIPPDEFLTSLPDIKHDFVEGLIGIRNLLVHVLPLFAMCDKQDIGGIVDSSNTGSPTIFIYDRYPGGIGFAKKGYEMVEDLIKACLELVEECGCEDGCPSCVGLPVLRPPIHTDPDVRGGYPIPNKTAALTILRHMLGYEPVYAR